MKHTADCRVLWLYLFRRKLHCWYSCGFLKKRSKRSECLWDKDRHHTFSLVLWFRWYPGALTWTPSGPFTLWPLLQPFLRELSFSGAEFVSTIPLCLQIAYWSFPLSLSHHLFCVFLSVRTGSPSPSHSSHSALRSPSWAAMALPTPHAEAKLRCPTSNPMAKIPTWVS